MKIIISGGGIGGLTAALCCIHHGHEVSVLERAPEPGEIGAGIQIPPNAMKVFKALGIDGALGAAGFAPQAIEARMGTSGLRLFDIPLADAAIKRWGAPYLHIHRADYICVLASKLQSRQSDGIRFGHEVTGYDQQADHVRVTLANGETVTGDVLIGADGINSPVRTQMLGPQAPVFTGNVAWRAVVPIDQLGDDAPRPTACAWMGRGRHCVTYRLRGGELANFVGVVERDDWTTESWTERGSTQDALEDFKGWHPTITRILQESSELYRWALFDRAPLKKWSDGRVTLLGDAAHPMLPFLAQGAAMAVEDAWAVAHELAKTTSIGDALQAYQAKRYARTTKAQAGSRANAKTFHKRNLPQQLATYGPMWLAGRITPSLVHKRQDDLYGYDITQETR